MPHVAAAAKHVGKVAPAGAHLDVRHVVSRRDAPRPGIHNNRTQGGGYANERLKKTHSATKNRQVLQSVIGTY